MKMGGMGEIQRQRMVDCRVVRCERVATETFRLRVTAPEFAQMSEATLPGQFVMIRVPRSLDPLLGRAFAIYNLGTDSSGEDSEDGKNRENNKSWLEIVFLRVGRATTTFSQLTPGERVTLWGPLGNGFAALNPNRYRHLICVAGGIGQTPMRLVLEEALGRRNFGRSAGKIERVSFCYGARNAAGFACLDEFESLGSQLFLTTEDGSCGEQGRVTGPLERLILKNDASRRTEICVMACGPKPMLVAVQKLLQQYGVQGFLSLETPMACGMGICFSCVAKIRVPTHEGGAADAWDYRRTCREGPVFDAADVFFDSDT